MATHRERSALKYATDVVNNGATLKGIEKAQENFRKDVPILSLSGTDGNVFAILGKARRAAKAAGWSEALLKEYTDKATSGDYDNALQVTMSYFDVV